MIRTDELKGVIAKNGYSQSDVAGMIGVTPKTFYEKMKIGVFGSDEIGSHTPGINAASLRLQTGDQVFIQVTGG